MERHFWPGAGVGLVLAASAWAGTTVPQRATKPAAPVKSTQASAARDLAAQTGIVWESSFTAATAKAQRLGKPVFLMQLFGRLDEKFC